jgi:hypothetical protein
MIRFLKSLTRRRRLLVAPYAALALDAALTLFLQSPEYWSGRYEAASESEVIGSMTLRLHPLAFVAWIGVWASLLGLVIAIVPRIIARITSVAAAVLHTFGLLIWVMVWSSNPYATYLCGVVCAALIVYSLESKRDAQETLKSGRSE